MAQSSLPQGFQRFEHILFKDNFSHDTIGRFPSGWFLSSGNFFNLLLGKFEHDYRKKVESGIKIMEDVDNGLCLVADKQKNHGIQPILNYDACPGDSLSFECDFRIMDEWAIFDIILFEKGRDFLIFNSINGDGRFEISVGDKTGYVFEQNGRPRKIKDNYPGEFRKKTWHHFAANIKNHIVTSYIDQYKVAVFTDIQFDKFEFIITAENDHHSEIQYKNFLITGGTCYPFNSLLTSSKFTTHAILFDYNRSTIRPESIDFIKQLANWLKENPTIKLEIDGNTDNDGEPAANLKLSQARADEVKKQLVSNGIDASRLTTKGFGASKPIQSNDTQDGKANNRRVEFIKQ